MATYTDKNGYKRHSNLIHRQKAYEQIYLKNKEQYPLPFSEYVVHHKDRDKKNNHISNLQILTPEEHEAIHKDISGYNIGGFGLSILLKGLGIVCILYGFNLFVFGTKPGLGLISLIIGMILFKIS